MTVYCDGKSKVTVEYTTGAGKQVFTTDKVPVDITCENISPGEYIFFVEASGFLSTDCSMPDNYPYSGDVIADRYEFVSGTPSPGYEHCSWHYVDFYIGNTKVHFSPLGGRYRITPRINPDNKKQLIIKTVTGEEIFRVDVTSCDFKISCDDDCPEGSHKCTHKAYPGYCCVPCKEVGSRLRNIASKVRG